MFDGFSELLGVVIGGLITFFSQYIFELCREKRKNRKSFLKQHYDINKNILILEGALKQFHSFAKEDLNKYTNEDLESELYPSIIRFSNECSNIWVDFRDIIFSYFYKLIDNNSILILDNAMYKIINANTGTKNMDFKVFRNIHNNLRNSVDEFNEALTIITDIENEYHKLERKIKRKNI